MTEQNRVLARSGARILTQAEMAIVGCGYLTPILFTEQLTNQFINGKLVVDHFPDERAA